MRPTPDQWTRIEAYTLFARKAAWGYLRSRGMHMDRQTAFDLALDGLIYAVTHDPHRVPIATHIATRVKLTILSSLRQSRSVRASLMPDFSDCSRESDPLDDLIFREEITAWTSEPREWETRNHLRIHRSDTRCAKCGTEGGDD